MDFMDKPYVYIKLLVALFTLPFLWYRVIKSVTYVELLWEFIGDIIYIIWVLQII